MPMESGNEEMKLPLTLEIQARAMAHALLRGTELRDAQVQNCAARVEMRGAAQSERSVSGKRK